MILSEGVNKLSELLLALIGRDRPVNEGALHLCQPYKPSAELVFVDEPGDESVDLRKDFEVLLQNHVLDNRGGLLVQEVLLLEVDDDRQVAVVSALRGGEAHLVARVHAPPHAVFGKRKSGVAVHAVVRSVGLRPLQVLVAAKDVLLVDLSRASPAESAQVVSAPVEACRGHRRLPLLQGPREVVRIGARCAKVSLVNDPGLESLGVSVLQKESVGAQDPAVFVLNFLNYLQLQLVCES